MGSLGGELDTSAKDIAGKNKDTVFRGVICLYLLFALCFVLLYLLQETKLEVLNIPFYILLFVAIGWGQFSLSLAFHEAVHFNFGNNHDDIFAGFISAYPIGLSMCYRGVHFAHHKYFADSAKDPDYNEFAYFPSSRFAMLKRALFMCSGVPAVKQLLTQSSEVKEYKCDYKMERARMIFTQIFIFLLFSNTLGPFFYIFFWVLPVATVGKLFSSTRLLCEHGNPNGKPVLRTITGKTFQSNTLGMFNFNYHADHHSSIAVPCGDLPAYHEARRKNEISFSNTENFHGGYLKLLGFWFKTLPMT
jgi:fatty acid desaturase